MKKKAEILVYESHIKTGTKLSEDLTTGAVYIPFQHLLLADSDG
jgi:hypothetical protein